MPSANVELLRKVYDAWGRGDFNSTSYAFDPQVEFVRVGPDITGEVAGHWTGFDEMRTALLAWLRSWENLRAEAERLIDLGDRVLALSHQTGRGKRSGIPLSYRPGELFTFRDTKIVRWEIYLDRVEAQQAAGLDGPSAP
jgi:ketosteroid isomerase-like protein